MSYDVRIIYDRLPKMQEQIHNAVRKTMLNVGDRILREAKRRVVTQNIIDTGNLLNSGYTRTKEEDNYPANIKFPGQRLPSPVGDLEIQINFSALYAVYHEEGTIHMSARPFLKPAVEAVRPQIVTMFKKSLRDEGLA